MRTSSPLGEVASDNRIAKGAHGVMIVAVSKTCLLGDGHTSAIGHQKPGPTFVGLCNLQSLDLLLKVTHTGFPHHGDA